MAVRYGSQGEHVQARGEDAARLAKATKLADVIEAGTTVDAQTLDALASMSDEWWAELAKIAGTREASVKTRGVVATLLRNRLSQRRKVALLLEGKGD